MVTMPEAVLEVRPTPEPPLISCNRFTTSDPDVAVTEATKILAPHHLVLGGDAAQFHAQASRAELHDASLYYIDYQGPTTFHCPPQDRYVAVNMPLTDDMTIAYDRGDRLRVPRGSLAVVPADRRVELSYRAGFSMLSVSADISALTAGLRRIAPDVDTDALSFDGVVAHDGRSAGTFYGLARLLAGVVDRYSSPTLIPPGVVNSLRDQIVSTFLLGLSHTNSEPMLRAARPITRRLVRQAISIVVSDSNAETSVTDIATQLGVSVRSLELGFRSELNCTPREYIQTYRLQKAYDELRRARRGDGTTVTDVAIRWGFNHTGRFAALYRRVYGVTPSSELR